MIMTRKSKNNKRPSYYDNFFAKVGLVRELNPGPLAPEARIIPLDQQASMWGINNFDSGGIRTHAPKDWCLKPAP